jgi:hypothetical protein
MHGCPPMYLRGTRTAGNKLARVLIDGIQTADVEVYIDGHHRVTIASEGPL